MIKKKGIHQKSNKDVRLTIHISPSLYFSLVEHRDNFMIQNKLGDPTSMPIEVYIPCLLASIEKEVQ